MDARIKKIIELLEKVTAGSLDAETALGEWPDIDTESDRLIISVWHDLSHYVNDWDIRQKDSSYAEAQISALRRGLSKILRKYGMDTAKS